MPVTPLHLGPALAVKSVCGRHFSVLVFAFSQVAMDLEPVIQFLRAAPVMHGYTHTFVGATLIGLLSVFVGRPLCQGLLRYFRPDPHSPFLVWLHGPDTISWPAAALSAFAGTYSHVWLDSIMHADMQPYAPWSAANPHLHAISTDALHRLCVASGAVGVLIMVLVFIAAYRAPHREH